MRWGVVSKANGGQETLGRSVRRSRNALKRSEIENLESYPQPLLVLYYVIIVLRDSCASLTV